MTASLRREGIQHFVFPRLYMKVRTWGALDPIPLVNGLKMLLGRDVLFLQKSQIVYFDK